MSEIAEESVVVQTAVETGGDDSGLYGDDVLDLFSRMEEQDEQEGEEGGEPDTQGAGGGNGAEGEKTPPDYPLPEGWEETMWQGMAPELRGKVDGMVKAHAEAMSAKEKAMREAEARQRDEAAKVNAALQNSLGIIRRVVEGEFAGIDWESLKKTDPAMFVELSTAQQQRLGAIRHMEQQAAMQAQAVAQAQAAEARQLMQAELDATLPKVRALVGAGFESKAFGEQLRAYLEKSGVPAEAVGMMSRGYELELATKAMLYDNFMEAKAKASAKVADAPKVQAPRGVKLAGEGDALARARARLDKNPNSGDAIDALFEAMYNGG